MLTTTPVPQRLAEDLRKRRITIRYIHEDGCERTVHFEGAYLEYIPRIVGLGTSRVMVPLSAVQSVEVDDEFTSPCDTDHSGYEVPQRLAVARWHRTDFGDGEGELLRYIPQGNA